MGPDGSKGLGQTRAGDRWGWSDMSRGLMGAWRDGSGGQMGVRGGVPYLVPHHPIWYPVPLYITPISLSGTPFQMGLGGME